MDTKTQHESWLECTNQIWKFRIFVVMIMTAFILLVMRLLKIADQDWKSMTIIIGIMAFGVLMLLIQCPCCKKRPMIKIMRQTAISELTQTMLTFRSCPYCNYDGKVNCGGDPTKPSS